jgi:hypothetical protein
MLDFGFNIDDGARGSASFAERIEAPQGNQDDWRLWPLTGDDDRDAVVPPLKHEGEHDYAISKIRALEPFLRKWTPVPVLRLAHGRGARGQELYDDGPSTWARLYVLELDERDEKTGNTHVAILALDTELEEDAPEGDAPYLSPCHKDAGDEREFRLVGDAEQIASFLRNPVTETDGTEFDQQKWVDEWLLGQFMAFKQAQRPNRELRKEDLPYRFEHWARYLAMLRLVCGAIRPPRLRLLDTVSSDRRYQAVDVDLILDIGNSRTCGILVESYPDETRVDLNNCYALGMRDLGQPELYYRRPFESRVEFAQVDFGPEHIARRSGRARPAFLWPSMLRVGPEAVRLVRGSAGTETISGLSSPKRYVWDDRPMSQDWRFHGMDARQSLPTAARSACRFLNEAGDVLAQVNAEEAAKLRDRGATSKTLATRPRFSRSSLYGFMLGELITHALVQINDVAGRLTRKQSDLPRRLRNVILTLPSTTPLQEQAIMRSRAEGALQLVWQVMGWTGRTLGQSTQMPRVIVDWDEASCTQLVWLYDEIAQKFGGQIEGYFDLMGKPRRRPEGLEGGAPGRAEPSLRVACIDIGGGTTDLMVSTYYSEDDREILPYQNVREGFRIAGDDLVHEVIVTIILPQLRDQLEAAGTRHAEELLRELFGGDAGDVEEQTRQRRRQFSLQILVPLAMAALERSEDLTQGESRIVWAAEVIGARTRPLHDVADDPDAELPPPVLTVAEDIVAYLEAPAVAQGALNWSLGGAAFEIGTLAIDRAVRDVLGPPLEAMLELIKHLDVDVVLLSGRPTRLLAIGDVVRESLAAMPHRVIAMHRYKIGGWYPYRDRVSNRIGDPKTTAAVGGMLCLLTANRIVNFKMHTDKIRMRSTARFIGEMERNGQILDRRVMFKEVDLQSKGRSDDTAVLLLRSPMHIGFRQLPHERWMGNPLYRLDFANESAQRLPTPLRVEIRRREYEGDAESQTEKLRAEAVKEAFVVESVEDAEGAGCKKDVVRLTLHTLGVDVNDYWLDTGIFRLH